MSAYDLPEAVDVGGQSIPIRSDFRAALDMIAALNDPELTDRDKIAVLLGIFCREPFPVEATDEALRRCLWFLSGGEDANPAKPGPKLMDWEQDFRLIAAPITKALGQDVRGLRLHWWTFLSLYMEIGDCTFAQVVAIRRKLASGKPLDKTDRAFYRANRAAIDLHSRYTADEDALIAQLTRKEADHG